MTTTVERSCCLDCHFDRLLQVLEVACLLKMFESRKPLFRTRLGEMAIISSNDTMHTTTLFYGQMRERKIAHLRMNRVDTPSKLDKRCLHKFNTCCTPILYQLKRDSLLGL